MKILVAPHAVEMESGVQMPETATKLQVKQQFLFQVFFMHFHFVYE